MKNYVIVEKKVLESFYRDSLKLDALVNAGFNNWDEYHEDMEIVEFDDYPFSDEIDSIDALDINDLINSNVFYKMKEV